MSAAQKTKYKIIEDEVATDLIRESISDDTGIAAFAAGDLSSYSVINIDLFGSFHF